MKDPIVVNGQAKAFEELASMLHVRRTKIAALVARKHNPLPIPPRQTRDNRFLLNRNYLRQLRHWVREEKNTISGSRRTALDLNRIEKELLEPSKVVHLRERWTIDESIDNFPPGHFLG